MTPINEAIGSRETFQASYDRRGINGSAQG
jgi:hypothetical protein